MEKIREIVQINSGYTSYVDLYEDYYDLVKNRGRMELYKPIRAHRIVIERIANAKITAIIIPSVITKYAPISPPIIKKYNPARYTDEGLSKPSGRTPVHPLILVLFVTESIPLLKSQ